MSKEEHSIGLKGLFLRRILPSVILFLYYLYFLYPAFDFFNQDRHPNRAYVLIFILALSSLHAVFLAALYKKNYDIIFLLLYKIFSYFPYLYIIVLEEEIFHANYLELFVLFNNATVVFVNSFFTVSPTGCLFFRVVPTVWPFLPMYIAFSIIPFVLARILTKNT